MKVANNLFYEYQRVTERILNVQNTGTVGIWYGTNFHWPGYKKIYTMHTRIYLSNGFLRVDARSFYLQRETESAF